MRTWGYEAPPNAARDRSYHPITDCWLDENGYEKTDDEVNMTNITPGVFTYGYTNTEEEGQILTTSQTHPSQFKIPKRIACHSACHSNLSNMHTCEDSSKAVPRYWR